MSNQSFSKIFVVDNHEILVRKSVDMYLGKPTALIIITTYLEGNEKIGLSPFVEFKRPFCCLGCADKNYQTIDQELVENIFPKMKQHSADFSKNLFLKSFHDN